MMLATTPVRTALLDEERPAFGAVGNSTETVERVLAGLKTRRWPWSKTVLDGVFEDLEQVLGEQCSPDEAEVHVLLCRIRGSLMQLVAAVPDSGVGPGPVDDVIDRARHLISTASAEDPVGPRGLLRRMALAAVDLLDELQPIS